MVNYARIQKSFKPPERLSVSEWAAKYFMLPITSAEPGRWNPERFPPQIEIMNSVDDPDAEFIILMCSAQSSKTTIGNAVIARQIHLDPSAMMLIQPTLEMAERYSKEKLSPMISDISVLSERITKKTRHGNSTILQKLFPGGFLTISGANSPSSLASSSIRFLCGDEIDKYPASAGKEGDPVKLAIERTTTFWNRLVFLYSTPSVTGDSRIEKEFNKTDQRHYFVPCPHCGHYQHLVWENIKYEAKDSSQADPNKGVYYVCANCEKPINENKKPEMIRSGEWRSTKPKTDKRYIGFHINRLYSPWTNWTDLALDYEASKDDPQQLQVFVNASLGLPFDYQGGEKLNWELLKMRGNNANYKKGNAPKGCILLAAGIDVQSDRLEIAVWGWGRGEQAWLVDYKIIFGDTLKDRVWDLAEQVTRYHYPYEDGGYVRVRATCVDSGYRTQDVYSQVRKRSMLNWFAIKGKSGEREPIVAVPKLQEIKHDGTRIKRGIKLFIVGTHVAKETLYARSFISEPGKKYLNFPNDLESDFYQGFCSEVKVTKHRHGVPYYIWEKINKTIRNEALDTSVYAYAAANILGLSRINWKEEKDSQKNEKNDKNEPILPEKIKKNARKKRVVKRRKSRNPIIGVH